MNHWCESCARKNLCYVVDARPKCFVPITSNDRTADRKTEPTMRLYEWTSDDITFCTAAKCKAKCYRKPKYIKHKDIPHSFADFSDVCGESITTNKTEPQTEEWHDDCNTCRWHDGACTIPCCDYEPQTERNE